MLEIDGTFGEGGGQVLRTCLALSVVTGLPFRITRIRGRRRRPGLMRQHLTAVEAAARVGCAAVRGAALGARELEFEPGGPAPGEHHFDVGSAGSAGLVLQTVLPALLTAGGPSRLVLEGGTHNPWAPPFDFLERAFLPLIERMGPRLEARLDRPGFYPAGGGRFTVEVEPVDRLDPLELDGRGAVVAERARVLTSRLPDHVARREMETLARLTGWPRQCIRHVEVTRPLGPGNAVVVDLQSERLCEVFTSFGARGVPAERVAEAAVAAARRYVEADVAVGEHLADQLLIPMVLAGGGRFSSLPPTPHTITNAEVIRRFLDVPITFEEIDPDRWLVVVGG